MVRGVIVRSSVGSQLSATKPIRYDTSQIIMKQLVTGWDALLGPPLLPPSLAVNYGRWP